MPDVTWKDIDEMETLYGGIARRARAELGVTAWGMQVMTLPPARDGHPDHEHGAHPRKRVRKRSMSGSRAPGRWSPTVRRSSCARA